jgi:hypothetical protein
MDTCLYELIYSEKSILPPPEIPETPCICICMVLPHLKMLSQQTLSVCSSGRHLHDLWCQPQALLFVRCRSCVVALRYEPDGPGYSLFEKSQTVCGPHQDSYLMGTSAKVKNEWSSTSTPSLCLHGLDKENNRYENKCIRLSSVGKLTTLRLYDQGSGVRFRGAGKSYSLIVLLNRQGGCFSPVKEAEAWSWSIFSI